MLQLSLSKMRVENDTVADANFFNEVLIQPPHFRPCLSRDVEMERAPATPILASCHLSLVCVPTDLAPPFSPPPWPPFSSPQCRSPLSPLPWLLLLPDELFTDGEGHQLDVGIVIEADRGECGEVGAAGDALSAEACWGVEGEANSAWMRPQLWRSTARRRLDSHRRSASRWSCSSLLSPLVGEARLHQRWEGSYPPPISRRHGEWSVGWTCSFFMGT
jgi:hypothetical protein